MEFNKKVDSLIGENQFVKQGLKTSSEIVSCEGAKKYSTTGDPFVDNFASASYYKEPRSYNEIAQDMNLLWSINPTQCVKLALYFRLITRKSKVLIKNKSIELNIQKGTGLRNEGIMRMLWIALNHPLTFKANIALFIAAGSWKDIIKMLSLDLQYHGWDKRKLNWNFLFTVISSGLINPDTTHLVRKYLPTIKNNKNCNTLEAQANTLIGRWLAHRLFVGLDKANAFKEYRKLKSDGKAHIWQQNISKQLYEVINFDSIAGRALALLVGSKFIKNHDLNNKYLEWIESKSTAKFTGFVFELFTPLEINKEIPTYKKLTINAQFMQLVEDTTIESPFLVVRDTSGSMMRQALGCKVSSDCIAKSMALYFSYFLKGVFSNTFAEFSDTCILKQWKGETPSDKYLNDNSESYGRTNMQSVIDLFIKLKEKGVPESDFPKGIILLSDGEFARVAENDETNFNVALIKLSESGFSKEFVDSFKIILWDIPNDCYGRKNKVKFEDYADAPNFFYLSGYDPSIISFIFGGNKPEIKAPKNAKELFEIAMDQTLLNKVRIIKSKKK